jgi:protein-tyrosine phosphatase
MSFVETHFHLLPGLDDGPADMHDTIELAQAALADGTGTIIATPQKGRLRAFSSTASL